ncbi:hypothetical protein ACJX0J_017943, partial [Zea mays]
FSILDKLDYFLLPFIIIVVNIQIYDIILNCFIFHNDKDEVDSFDVDSKWIISSIFAKKMLCFPHKSIPCMPCENFLLSFYSVFKNEGRSGIIVPEKMKMMQMMILQKNVHKEEDNLNDDFQMIKGKSKTSEQVEGEIEDNVNMIKSLEKASSKGEQNLNFIGLQETNKKLIPYIPGQPEFKQNKNSLEIWKEKYKKARKSLTHKINELELKNESQDLEKHPEASHISMGGLEMDSALGLFAC